MFENIKRYFPWNNMKDLRVEKNEEKPKEKEFDFMDYIDLTNIEKINPVNEFDIEKKTVLFVDDYVAMESLYSIAFNNDKEHNNRDFYSEFNVYNIFGENAGKKALKIIEDIQIDYAILDLTLGEIIKYDSDKSEKYYCIDGVDIAKEILNKYPDCKIKFVTAHNLNTKYERFKMFMEKFHSFTNLNIDEHYINKLEENRDKKILDFVYNKD